MKRNMSAGDDNLDAVDLDETSFNLDNVDMIDDEVVDVHDHVGVDVDVGTEHELPEREAEIDEEKKKAFEKKREEILSAVPQSVKERFGKIYFSTFGKFIGPVLIMNPYKVDPKGALRKQWMGMFHNCKKSGREEQMTHLTYWYGTYNDLHSAYSFQKTSSLMSYELGMKKTEKKLRSAKQRLSEGKKMIRGDSNFINGFDEMEADRLKDPTERCGYVGCNFLEEYHIEEGHDNTTQETPEHKKEQKKAKTKSSDGAIVKKRKLKKMGNKSKTKKIEKKQHREEGTQEAAKNGETPKPKKKLVKKSKKKADSSIDISRPMKKKKTGSSSGATAKDPNTSSQSSNREENHATENGNRKRQEEDVKGSEKGDEDVTKGATKKAKDKRPSAYDEYVAMVDVSSHGETDDENLELDDLQSSDDSEDEDYMVNKTKPKASKKKTLEKKSKSGKSSTKRKEVPKKKAQKIKIKLEKPATATKDKKSAAKPNLKHLYKKEQRKFHECEALYLPLLHRWEKAITNKDANQLSRIYDELLSKMEMFTAPFMEAYEMGNLMKRSRGFENEKRKRVLSKFKTVYKEKKAMVPKDFKPVKESEKYVSPDTTNTVPPTKLEPPVEETSQPKDKTPLPKPDEDGQTPNQPPVTAKSGNEKPPVDTPMPAVPKKSLKRSQSGISFSDTDPVPAPVPPLPKKNQSSAAKAEPKRRSFSLGKLMRPGGSSSPTPGSMGAKPISSSVQSSSQPSAKKSQKTSHLWTTEISSSDNSSKNEDRTFGLEFLQQAALFIPEGKTVNRNAVARNLETAVYHWATRDGGKKKEAPSTAPDDRRWLDKYWNKIHDLSACVSGKRRRGTLADMIAEGKFATPDELVGLGGEDLWRSFQGSPLEC